MEAGLRRLTEWERHVYDWAWTALDEWKLHTLADNMDTIQFSPKGWYLAGSVGLDPEHGYETLRSMLYTALAEYEVAPKTARLHVSLDGPSRAFVRLYIPGNLPRTGAVHREKLKNVCEWYKIALAEPEFEFVPHQNLWSCTLQARYGERYCVSTFYRTQERAHEIAAKRLLEQLGA